VGYALPGIVIALSWFSLGPITPLLYQTLAMLVLLISPDFAAGRQRPRFVVTGPPRLEEAAQFRSRRLPELFLDHRAPD
jgi:ABC-type Fe3+ transport system permease subunit